MYPDNINTLNNSNNNSNMGNFDCQTRMKEAWASIPLFTRFVILYTLILYFFNLFFPVLSFFLSILPFYTIERFQFWRLFTAVYLTTSILNILFAFLSWLKEASNLEKSMGTIKYFFVFTINSVCIQIIYVGIMYMIYLITDNKNVLIMGLTNEGVETNGLWPIIMAEITMLCMANPDALMRFFLFPCTIKAKYYPFLLFGLFTLFSGFQIQFDLFAGIIYGVFHHYVLKDKLTLSDEVAQKLEKCIPFSLIKKINGFVPVGSSSLPFSIVVTNNAGGSTIQNDSTTETNSTQSSKSSNSNSFKAFSGKGVTVGGSLGLSNGDYEGISQNPSQ